jgi:protein-tyrosine phosphatase
MIDLHFHLVPEVDDGPETLEEAVAMARAAHQDGCTVVVATPHQRHMRWSNFDHDALRAGLERVRDALGPQPEITLGAEIRDGYGLLDDLERGLLLGLGEGSSLLLEVDRRLPNHDLGEVVHELVIQGYPPLLAHVERIPWLAADLELIGELVSLGASTQVTAGSLLGEFGKAAEHHAWRLLDAGLVDVLASDAHRLAWRRPGLSVARARIERRYGAEVGALLTEVNPAAILAGNRLAR